MYKNQKMPKETLTGVRSYAAESIEAKIRRVMTNKEPIKDSAPLIYTERAEGVLPDYDIRTDKYEHLVEGHDALTKSKRARKEGIGKAQKDLDKQNSALNGPQTSGDPK